jgi:hypothetical protein
MGAHHAEQHDRAIKRARASSARPPRWWPPWGKGRPGDGADGPGFRVRGTIGPVKGPYLPPDRFLIGTADGMHLKQHSDGGGATKPPERRPLDLTER